MYLYVKSNDEWSDNLGTYYKYGCTNNLLRRLKDDHYAHACISQYIMAWELNTNYEVDKIISLSKNKKYQHHNWLNEISKYLVSKGGGIEFIYSIGLTCLKNVIEIDFKTLGIDSIQYDIDNINTQFIKELHNTNLYYNDLPTSITDKLIIKEDFQLRDYQVKYIDSACIELNINSSVVIQAPVGSGKTIVTITIILRQNYKRILIFTPRLNINDQWINCIAKYCDMPIYDIYEFIKLEDNCRPDKYIVLACYQSPEHINIIDNTILDLTVFDECHHFVHKWIDDKEKFILLNKLKNRLFLSATLYKDQENGIYGKRLHYITEGEMITRGYAKPIYTLITDVDDYDMNIAELTIDMITKYDKFKVCVFCSNQSNAKSLLNSFKHIICENIYNISVYLCISDTNESYTQLKDFENDIYPSICISVNMISLGYDHPPIDGVVFADNRSGLSIMQMIGRGLRLYKDAVLHVLIPLVYKETFIEYIIAIRDNGIINATYPISKFSNEDRISLKLLERKCYEGNATAIAAYEYCVGHSFKIKCDDIVRILKREDVTCLNEYNQLYKSNKYPMLPEDPMSIALFHWSLVDNTGLYYYTKHSCYDAIKKYTNNILDIETIQEYEMLPHIDKIIWYNRHTNQLKIPEMNLNHYYG